MVCARIILSPSVGMATIGSVRESSDLD